MAVAAKVPDVATAAAAAVAHKAPVVTEAMAAVMVVDKAAGAVANTPHAHKAHGDLKAIAVVAAAAVKAVDVLQWVTHNPAAMKADLAAAWASALPALRQVASRTPCAPVSI